MYITVVFFSPIVCHGNYQNSTYINKSIKHFQADIVSIFVTDSELPVSLEIIRPTLELAAIEINEKYSNINFNIVFRNGASSCKANVAGAYAAEEYFLRRVTAFVGPACTLALDPVGRMASYWNIPIYTAGGIDTTVSDKSIFTTLTRLSFSLEGAANFILEILKEFNWHHIAIIVDETNLQKILMKRSLVDIFKDINDYELFYSVKEFSNKSVVDANFTKLLTEASKEARVFVLVTEWETIRSLLLEAYNLGMGNGEYTFFTFQLNKNKKKYGEISWYIPGDYRNKDARKMYEALMVVTLRVPATLQYKQFSAKVLENSRLKYNSNADETMVDPILGAFYDCVLLYAYVLNKTLVEGGDPLDGRNLAEKLWNSTFYGGMTGDIFINANGDREADFTLSDLDPETGIMRPVATYYGVRRRYDRISRQYIHWPGGLKGPPPDIPYCGFTGDEFHCLPQKSFSVLGSVGITVFGLCAIGSIAGALFYKHLVRKTNKQTLLLIFLSFQGNKVVVKPLQVSKLSLSRQVMVELKQMGELSHENLVRFIGMCVEEPNYVILTELCIRGSLRDMLENDAMNIDWTFRYSMISDVLEGMKYIHDSSLEYHGRLKSTNCVIHGRFIVKITDYGLKYVHEQIDVDTKTNPRSLFWMAPEHLREPFPTKTGSKKGDIYSFAIILQEIITRSGPFESVERHGRNSIIIDPEEILDRVRMGTTPPYRPEIAYDECSAELMDLVRACWSELPGCRPSFADIKVQFKKITKGVSNKNLLDNLLARMEQYANNLEQLVEEKSESLIEEKKKTDELLCQLLPRFVAEELKKGNHVRPEAFECVTIFFSDIVGFTALSAESTPMEVVDFLNDLYTCFDSIIDNYDVYKVETIGDAYMVVSGLPIKNGIEHAREIARLSLDLLVAIGNFKIRHKPERKLKLRIGIHSGPCVAGVVGLKMPRYCLFGDTVNTASRMESNGEALRIHVSHETKKILDIFGNFHLSVRGDIELKGKGLMRTYWLDGEDTPVQKKPIFE
ncbi:atrial natriuretic peptide receptor 1-like [Tachypleus tridentatus]|uniref:atrial natriuretic peptide receptor 1-like n=1 Tax=Tachypleus tridentatus TaxID=6853 RepID=UPI003FD22982